MIINSLNEDNDNYKNIHVLNRAQLIDDARAFVEKDILKLEVLINLMDYLKKENDYIAWYPARQALAWLKSKLIGTKYYEPLKVIIFYFYF